MEMRVGGGSGVPEDWGDAGVTEDRGEAKKEEPTTAVGVEGRSPEDTPCVCGGSRAMTDHGGAGGTREPSGKAELSTG